VYQREGGTEEANAYTTWSRQALRDMPSWSAMGLAWSRK
jgi:hypothetical protein